MQVAFVLFFLGNGIFKKLESSFLWSPILGSHPLVSSMVTAEVGNGLWYHLGKQGRDPDKVLNGRSLPHACERSKRSEERSKEKNKVAINKAGIVWEMDPFQNLSKPPFHKAWQGYSIEPGCQPSMALICVCQTVCCVYLPRLTNWTFVGLAALPENWSFCYLLQESFHGIRQKLDWVMAGFFFCSGCFFFPGMLLLFVLLCYALFVQFQPKVGVWTELEENSLSHDMRSEVPKKACMETSFLDFPIMHPLWASATHGRKVLDQWISKYGPKSSISHL